MLKFTRKYFAIIFISLCIFIPIESSGGILEKLEQKLNKKTSANGDADAQYNKGYSFYHGGDEVAINYKEAFKWFQLAAKQGLDKAQSNLGVMYQNGQGVPQDYKEAVKWYTKAAEQGLDTAQYNLGVMYDNGQGVPQDYKEAVKWYTKAAEQGLALAQNNLGWMFLNGAGIEQNYNKALKLFQLAANQGLDDAQENIKITSLKIVAQKIKGDSIRVDDLILDEKIYLNKKVKVFGLLYSEVDISVILDESLNGSSGVNVYTKDLNRADRKFILGCNQNSSGCWVSVTGTVKNELMLSIHATDIIHTENYNKKINAEFETTQDGKTIKDAEKGSEVPSAKRTVNCSSETDSLKRLTCYDNIPENLKKQKCSSISDSLKRLSCFDS